MDNGTVGEQSVTARFVEGLNLPWQINYDNNSSTHSPGAIVNGNARGNADKISSRCGTLRSFILRCLYCFRHCNDKIARCNFICPLSLVLEPRIYLGAEFHLQFYLSPVILC